MNYFLWFSGQEHGPYTEEQIRAAVDDGTINSQETARIEDSSEWKPLSELVRLKPRVTHKETKPKATPSAQTTAHVEPPSAPIPARNPSLLYTNLLLTVIAACLVFQVTRTLAPTPIPVTIRDSAVPVTVQNPTVSESMPATLDVRVVEVTKPVDINVSRVGGDSLSRVGTHIVLPVGVHNTVDVDIKGLNGQTMMSHPASAGRGASGLPVVILNQ